MLAYRQRELFLKGKGLFLNIPISMLSRLDTGSMRIPLREIGVSASMSTGLSLSNSRPARAACGGINPRDAPIAVRLVVRGASRRRGLC